MRGGEEERRRGGEEEEEEKRRDGDILVSIFVCYHNFESYQEIEY